MSGAELDIYNILSSIKKSCKDMLEEKFVSRVELDIDINFSFTEKSEDILIEKQKGETRKEEESFMTPLQA